MRTDLALALGEVRLGVAVAGHVDELEADLVHHAPLVLEGEREVAVDAALDLVAFGDHADRLGHGERAVAARR